MTVLLPGVRVLRDGHVVVGGSPWRAVVLGPRRAAQLRALPAGEAADADVLALLVRHGLAGPQPPTAPGTALRAGDVTVVIPVHDDARRLPAALACVPEGASVVVVDDGSRDGSADVARARGATVVRHEEARGPAAARNAGLAQVATPYVAFVDADVSAEPSWVTALLPHLVDPRVALVGPRITALDPHDPHAVARYEAALSPLDRGPDAASVEPRGAVDYLPAAALVGRTSALQEVGGFDESLHFGEDVDLCHRLHARGWQVRYEPAATVQHDHRTSWWAWLRRRAAYTSGTPAVVERHGSPQPPVPAAGGLAALWLLAGPGSLRRRVLVSGAVAAAGAAATTARAVAAGVPARAAAEGGLRREAAGAQRVLGMIPRHQALPLAAAWAVLSRRGAVVVPGAVLLQHLRRWRALQPDLSAPAFVAMRVLDEGALAAGLWRACWRARTLRPLLPPLRGQAVVRQEPDPPQEAGFSPASTGMPAGDGS